MEYYTRLWNRLVWFIHSCPMRIFKWTPDFHPSKESPLTPIWVHFHGLPLYLFEGEGLLSVANSIDSSIVDGFWQTIEYDDVPPYCSKCLHMGHRLEDCKRDLEKEQGKGQKAPYVNHRVPYRRVVNSAKTEVQKGIVINEKNLNIMPHVSASNVSSSSGMKEGADVHNVPTKTPYVKRGHVVENWIKKLDTKNNSHVIPEKEGVSTTNSFVGLDDAIDKENGLDGVERGPEVVTNSHPMGGLDSKVKGAHIDQGLRMEADESLVEENNMPIDAKKEADNLKGPTLEGLMVVPKDFQEPMGAVYIEFTSQSAPSSAKSMARAEELNGSRAGAEQSGQILEASYSSMSPQRYQTSPICFTKEVVAREAFLALVSIEKVGESFSHVE
ncbi:hypothetical protein LIER_11673 [Lithospermum erythrorhizon]|uniref:DUF4283 domain-containing protein n=1 Tax=Lithospermum erythrorhizon TaxID=34254 RepID=A0AAV3PQW8_LITER